MGAALLSVFGALALLLAVVGVYGVLSYSVNQQTREIGIRMAMGAQTGSVLRLVVEQGMRLAHRRAGAGPGGCFRRYARAFQLLFGVSAHDPLIFGGDAGFGDRSFLACYIPARRAHESRSIGRAALRIIGTQIQKPGAETSPSHAPGFYCASTKCSNAERSLPSSERKFQRQLHDAARPRRGNLAEVGRVDIVHRQQEVHVVEDVEELRSELEIHRFANRNYS